VSEGGIHVAVARTRAGAFGGGASDAAPAADRAAVLAALGEVMDPELPMVSIVELGMVGAVSAGATIRVALLPTFIGCPAIELIRSAVEARLAVFGRPVEVTATFEPPWTSDRITTAGLASLAAAGIAPPADPAATRCPYCASGRVVLDSLFGPTQCRSLFYCRDCRQPFEAIKPI
jgi:ring-1,2-phenylacetyl-CoA epoxidase subunit PaaD